MGKLFRVGGGVDVCTDRLSLCRRARDTNASVARERKGPPTYDPEDTNRRLHGRKEENGEEIKGRV